MKKFTINTELLNNKHEILMMKQLTSADSLDELLSQQKISLLYFTASWCGPCKSMSPVVEGVSDMMNGRFNTIKVDIDQLPIFAADYGIRSVPTLMLVKNGEIIDQRVGGLPPQQLMQWLEQLI
ncbi:MULTISPECIES: co-chaperone YbbN [unclassified Colwellia]|uniref:thioredoxin family protein n=2 Tax=Colwellia TaxID=28228 RepID=UPI0015F4A5CB|nr:MULTISPECIES: thioredoxin family protein [unclassified Colwellia]MBA6257214.1 thioredoxin family protein [Colwellia sp. MB3u-28]